MTAIFTKISQNALLSHKKCCIMKQSVKLTCIRQKNKEKLNKSFFNKNSK